MTYLPHETDEELRERLEDGIAELAMHRARPEPHVCRIKFLEWENEELRRQLQWRAEGSIAEYIPLPRE